MRSISARKMQQLPKMLIHEHLDCSLRPRTMLELWEALGFASAKMPFPDDVLTPWQEGRRLKNEKGKKRKAQKLIDQAVAAYQSWLVSFAALSLKNYVDAIVMHVLPLMQTEANLERITRERIEDAARDGVIGFELRFAPQLHTWGGLSLDKVMKAVERGLAGAPMAVKLIVCSLRHENDKAVVPVNPINELADLAIRHKRYVSGFDLAADEHKYPGVLPWWLPAAERVRKAGIGITIHLWETDEPTERDLELLNRYNIRRIGHGIRGNSQGHRVLEVCPTSNVVTAQVASFEEHPIDRLYRERKLVTVNTDGTLFTQVDLTGEYLKLQRHFRWGMGEFYAVNCTALAASFFSASKKKALRRQLDQAYVGYSGR